MEIELSKKRFILRADLSALRKFEEETGLKFSSIGEDSSLWEIGSLIFYFAQRGAEYSNTPFTYDQDTFLGLIELTQVNFLVTVVGGLLGGAEGTDTSEKKGAALK